ncbi:MAG: isoaspartyl peptidase/L-asparaginase [Elusimicrobia bacterium]|nr:isoaspartyl peptidase/L-asparaginase [Elusimicrobiota bacterium]
MTSQPAIIAHGGVGSPPEYRDGCVKAVERGMEILTQGGEALEAVVQAVAMLEEDGRFNAGRGSVLRLDGETIEMDASVMDAEGRIGAVAAIRGTPHPVLVARKLLETPHILLAGEGATRFAGQHGLSGTVQPSQEARRRFQEWQRRRGQPTSTVGAVARDRQGRFAVASSTGGSNVMLLGRVGDTPLVGCGFYAGAAGAVAVTGIGEAIIKRMVAKAVYDGLAAGRGVQAAAQGVMKQFPQEIPLGIIALDVTHGTVVANRPMAAFLKFGEGSG